MAVSRQQLANHWINDHLDLYNYAVQIGDTAWQDQIMNRLNNRDRFIEQECEAQLKHELWLRFDQINAKMLSIYSKIKASAHAEDHIALLEEAWALKLERVRLGRKLRGLLDTREKIRK